MQPTEAPVLPQSRQRHIHRRRSDNESGVFCEIRGDATLCDDAEFEPSQMAETPMVMRRGIRAGLIGHTQRIIWTVADDGWIFEARETNRDTAEFHGYPVLLTETRTACFLPIPSCVSDRKRKDGGCDTLGQQLNERGPRSMSRGPSGVERCGRHAGRCLVHESGVDNLVR